MREAVGTFEASSFGAVSGGGKPRHWRLAGLLIALFALAAMALPAFASAGPNLQINASHTPAGNLANGETATFTGSLVNTGNTSTLPGNPSAAINGMGIFVEIPAGTTVVDFGSDDESYWNGPLGDGCQMMGALGVTQILCFAPGSTTLAPNESTPPLHITLKVDGSASGSIDVNWNGQQIPIAGPSMYPQFTDSFTVDPAPALSLTTTEPSGLIKRGSTVALDLDLMNNGQAPTDGSAVTITDTLPAGLTLDSASSPGGYWSCAGTQTVSCTSTAAIAAGASAPTLTLNVAVGASAADTVTNEALASGGGTFGEAESSTVLPIFEASAQPIRLMVDPHDGATADGDTGSFIRIHKAGEPTLLDFSKASGPVILNGAVDGDEVRIPQGSIQMPEFTIPNFDLGVDSLAIALDMHIGMEATGDWGGTIDSSGNADLAMPMKFNYTLRPGVIPLDAFVCETGPVDLNNLTTGHQDASNTLPPEPVTDGSPFTDGNGTVIDNGFTVGAAQACAISPLVGVLVHGVTSPIITALINASLGTLGAGSAPGNADAQIQLHVVDPADPVITLEKSVVPGGELFIDSSQVGGGTYQLAVTNSGGSATDGSDITVTDELPEGTAFDSFASSDPNWGCAASGQTVTCTLTGTALAPGAASDPVEIAVSTDRFAWPSVVNTAAASGGGATGASHAVEHTDLTVHGSWLGLEVSGPEEGYTVGQSNAKVEVRVNNLSSNATGGQPTSDNVYVTGHLPPGVTYDTGGNVSPWNCNAPVPDENGQDVTCNLSGGNAINPGGQQGLGVPVIISQDAADTVETSWSATGGGAPPITDPNDVTASSEVLRPALELAMSAEGDFSNGGSGGSFVISLENTGTGSTTANQVKITDTLPAGLTPVNTTSEGGYWNCSTTGQRVACDNGAAAIEAGESAPDLNITVAVEDPPVPVLTNVARTTGGASPPASASATVNTARPSLSVSSAHSGDFSVGGDGVYRLLVSNNGDTATDGSAVTLTDVLPAGLSYAGASSAGGFWDCSASGQVVSCSSSAVIEAASKAPVLRLSASVGRAALPGVTNVVRVTGGGSLPASDADPTRVVGSPGPQGTPRLGKVVVAPKAKRMRPGSTAVFRVRVANSGNAASPRARVCLRVAKRFVRVGGGNCRNLGALGARQAKVVRFRVRLKGAARNLRRNALPVRAAAALANATPKVRKANARIRVVKPRRRR